MKKIFFLSTLSFLIYNQTYAGGTNVNIEVDSKRTTNCDGCQKYVESIVKLCNLYIQCEDSYQREYMVEQISFMKERLKKCEQKNGKGTNVTVGGGHTFD
ncbi:MAG: hypothetical protein Q8S31_00860 [Alphaproteobacteria bacterium]|nr:hypothetical protein [Alphaproteobacteria bacterium]